MPRTHQYWAYMLTNKGRTTLYIGVTNDLQRRLFEHRTGKDPNSFAWNYQCWTLVHLEPFKYVKQAIAREKQLKNWKREWKNKLIEEENPSWADLSKGWDYRGWFDPESPPAGFYTQNSKEAWGGVEGQR
ncbi:MAG: GIY-YIG nuclease family protein [Flavobacteriales bacterium]|nr:GIY-YIG nuclease family protein [Flavobacteriales bacterium]